MRGFSTAFWTIVLIGATASIAAGFAGGRSIGFAAAPPPQQIDDDLPAPISEHFLTRQLVGAHSLDEAVDEDPYGDPARGVSDYDRSPGGFDPRTDRAKIAVLVIDAGRSSTQLGPFLSAPMPLNLVVGPGDDGAADTIAAIRNAGKAVVVDAMDASPREVATAFRDGADAVIASLDEHRADALMHALDRRALVIDADLAEDDDVFAAARATRHPALIRDVIADARDDGPYVDFMLRDALSMAERDGQVIVAIHARSDSYDMLARFADQAQRDGADFVSVADLRT